MLKKVELKIEILREKTEQKKTTAKKEDGRLHQNNIRTPDVISRPKQKNLSRRKVSLMKGEEVLEMKRTTKDIRKMFQDRIQRAGPKTTPTAATTTTTAAERPLINKVSATTSKSNQYSVSQVDNLCLETWTWEHV